MKIIPQGQPAPQRPPSGPTATEKALAAFNDPGKVQAAKAALSGNPITAQAKSTAQEHPVLDPNQVSVEELSALNIPKEQIQEPEVQEEAAKVEPEKQQPDPQLSKQFAHLAKQSRLLRQQQQALKQREAELKAKESAMTTKPDVDLSGYVSIDELKNNPLGTLTKAKVTYDELTQQILNSGSVDPRTEALIKQQENRIAQLEAKIDEGAKNQTKQQDDAYKAAVRQIEVDVRNLIKNDPTYETIKSTNSSRDVVELITETYKKDGYVMTVEEAANEVENYLVDEALKLTRIGKIKSKLAEAAQPKPAQQTPAKPQTSQMKTLTNAHGTSRQLSAKERAILAFHNKL